MSTQHPHVDRLDPETQATLETLAALRSGAMVREFAARLIDVVNAVIDMHQVTDNGKVVGPTGSVQLTLTVSPSQEDPKGTVTFVDKIVFKRPEDRAWVVFVGKGGTVHARPQDEDRYRQMSLLRSDEVAPSLVPHEDGAGDDHPLPYKD